ncbi:MAG: hypothetical protein K2K64_01130 [Muribaculaceae bacterium]|nr:hypothetical protein [Muribaculaceae bacterium]
MGKNLLNVALAAAILGGMPLMTSCGGSKTEGNDSVQVVDEAPFVETQPIKSGEYYALRYDIEGENARKGAFDGRLMATLSPELTVLYVYENGNRTKIDHKVILEKPFEKGDSGLYRSVDSKGLPVVLATDSTVYVLTFEKGKEKYNISFDSKPKSEASAFDMQQRINEQIQKNK